MKLKALPLTIAVTALAVLVLVAYASGRPSAVARAAGRVTIRYNTTGGTVSPPEVASYLGYLPNIKLDPVGSVNGGPADIQSVATGQADIGEAFNGSIVKLITAGGRIRAVVGSYGSNSITNQGVYVLPKSPIHTAKDLIGKKIAVNTLGANAEAVIDLWLARQGLTPAQIKQVELVVVPPINEAETLRQGRVDAMESGFQLLLFAEKEGPLRTLFTDTQLLGSYTGGSYVLRDDFIKQHPAIARELAAGIAKAIRWEQTEPVSKVIAAMDKFAIEHGRSSDVKFNASWKSNGISVPGGYLTPADFEPWIRWMIQTDQLHSAGQVALSHVYTNEFNPYAPAGS